MQKRLSMLRIFVDKFITSFIFGVLLEKKNNFKKILVFKIHLIITLWHIGGKIWSTEWWHKVWCPKRFSFGQGHKLITPIGVNIMATNLTSFIRFSFSTTNQDWTKSWFSLIHLYLFIGPKGLMIPFAWISITFLGIKRRSSFTFMVQ